jgi:acyl-CoA dehydrogenase
VSERAPVPPFTAEHERLRLEIRRFVQERLRPHADDWEEAQWFPNEVFAWLAEAGYLGLKFPREYGGGGDTVAAAVFVEEMARCGSGGLAAGLGAHTGIALPPIAAFGTEAQKERYLVPGLRGELIAALAITEPGAGSDVAGIRTHARRVDGGYLVNGAKTFIIDACLQIHGLEAPAELERALRDARLGPIGGGTDEIMKEILGRSLGL